MARFEKENIRIYDEPITYGKFNGGINNTPANESMQDNELRDAVNWHYNETVLERRLGAKIVADLTNLDSDSFEGLNTENMQGCFIYGIGDNTYIITVVDGRIFSSLINKDILDAIDYDLPPLQVTEIEILASVDKLKNLSGGGTYNVTQKIDNEFEGLVLYNSSELTPEEHHGYLYTDLTNDNKTKLIVQNTKLVEGIGINDEFRLASGTRLIRIYEKDSVLYGEVVKPEAPTGWEYNTIGMNRLSPYPLRLIKSSQNAITTSIQKLLAGNLDKAIGETNITTTAVLDYSPGKTAGDYYFKWESMLIGPTGVPETDWVTINNGTQRLFSSETSKGLNTITGLKVSQMNGAIGKKIRIRCTFSEDFERVNTQEGTTVTTAIVTEDVKANSNTSGYTEETIQDYRYDVLKKYGSTYVEINIVANDAVPVPEVDDIFLDIHSCRKVIADGTNIIFYDDYKRTGNWYKTVTKQYNYMTDLGSLNFQTNKNEALIKAINFEGNIVCFGYNNEIGGNISVVLGSGDDFDDGSGYYSPYRRKIANTNITTDHPNTVQVAENNLIFKFRDSIYLIESKQLDAERIDVIPVNDKLKHYTWLKDASESFDTNTMVQMPNIHNNKLFSNVDYERRVFSEVTEDYYSLIFPEQQLRWKMYFKLPIKYQNDPKIYYPWLRDISENAFNIFGVFYLKGISTMVTKNFKVLQFSALDYKDLKTDIFYSRLFTKAYDLGYPKFVKFLQNLNVYYYRDYSMPFKLNIEIKNESDHDIYGMIYEASHEYAEDSNRDTIVDRIVYKGLQPIEQEILIADVTTLENAVLGPQPRYTSKVFTPISMSPFLSISVELNIEDATNVTIGSLGFNFVTANVPDESMQNYYADIIKF